MEVPAVPPFTDDISSSARCFLPPCFWFSLKEAPFGTVTCFQRGQTANFQTAGDWCQSPLGPSALDELRTHAVARLLLDNFPHIKAYWVTLTVPVAQIALAYGATDFDGTVLAEQVHHTAGSQAPQALEVRTLQRLIREAGCEPVERDHLYRRVLRAGQGPEDWRVA